MTGTPVKSRFVLATAIVAFAFTIVFLLSSCSFGALSVAPLEGGGFVVTAERHATSAISETITAGTSGEISLDARVEEGTIHCVANRSDNGYELFTCDFNADEGNRYKYDGFGAVTGDDYTVTFTTEGAIGTVEVVSE